MLPKLPTIRKNKEADFGMVFRKWWNLNPIKGPIEHKDTAGRDYLPFAAVTDEQVAIQLSAGSSKGVLIRVAQGTTGASDYAGFVNSPAWIVIKYPKAFYVISIDSFIYERDKNVRKSLTEERAKAIATYEKEI